MVECAFPHSPVGLVRERTLDAQFGKSKKGVDKWTRSWLR